MLKEKLLKYLDELEEQSVTNYNNAEEELSKGFDTDLLSLLSQENAIQDTITLIRNFINKSEE